jgi:hypothetical protein
MALLVDQRVVIVEIIEPDDAVPAVEQLPGQPASYEAGGAGDENGL